MLFRNHCPHTCGRLTAVIVAASLAGCSLNPFAKDKLPPQPVASAPAAASSMDATSTAAMAAPAPSQPVLQKISEPVPLASGAPNEYVVKPGDTLWDIASTFLKDPWYWPEIWYANPDIENPHLIYPGDVLGMVTIDGMPRITTTRGSAYRLSPQARITPLSQAVNSIPHEAVSAFLTTGYILEKGQAEQLPYIVDTRGDHLIAAAGTDIYVRGMTNTDAAGGRYTIVHVGDKLIDPDDNRLVGYQGIMVGEGRLRRNGDPATVLLTDTSQEATRGDRLLAEVNDTPLNFFPKAPSTAINGRILSVIGGVTQIGQYQVVVLNRGANNGLAVGDVLSVFRTGEVVKDSVKGGKVRLPDEQAGTLMVFKVYDRISYGLIMEATQAIHLYDTVRNPI